MIALVLAAIRARGAQAAILFALTALALATATAAPWYVIATARSVALADVAAAQPAHLAARAVGSIDLPRPPAVTTGAELLDQARSAGSASIEVPGASPSVAIWLSGRAAGAADPIGLPIAYRDEVCAALIIDGACPTTPDQALLSRRTAEILGVSTGDEVTFRTNTGGVAPLRLTGLYQVREPLDPYWALSDLASAGGSQAASASVGDPLFVLADALTGLQVEKLNADYHLTLPTEAFLGADGYDISADLALQRERPGTRWRVETAAPQLADRVTRERHLLELGVSIAAAQLLLLCWCALYFAVRHTGEARRADIGLLKLRGGTRRRAWNLAVAQSAVPMLAGALVGAAAGALGAWLFAGGITEPDQIQLALGLSGVAGAAALAGALIAVCLPDLHWLGRDVTDLLRRVPQRRGWRADVTDLVVVAVAVAGIYQAYAVTVEPGEAAGLTLLAPALIALVVALLAARTLAPLAAVTGARALRAGRLPVLLAATSIARRPGTHRVFALLTVAVAILATAVFGVSASTRAGQLRAGHDIGADRVLTVEARSRAHLLTAVRAADPTGRQAMAVVRGAGAGGRATLAVDSPRFASVVTEPRHYLPAGSASPAELLRPAAPEPVRVGDGELTLVASGAPVLVTAQFVTIEGRTANVDFGPIGAAPAAHRATVTGCGDPAAGGCRLVGLGLFEPSVDGPPVEPDPGRQVRIDGLSGPAGQLLDAAVLADPARWRGDLRAEVLGVTLVPTGGQLTVVAGPRPLTPGVRRSTWAYLVDGPSPVPVLLAGEPGEQVPGDPRAPVFGGLDLPARVVAVVERLPQLPRGGLLVDLEYADRIAPTAGGTGDLLQVWLAAEAPAGFPDLLADQGLTVLTTETIAETADLISAQGPPAASRFQLFAGMIGLLMGAGALTVAAAAERPDRAAELAALRVQGMPARPVRRVIYGGPLLLVGLAVGLGVAAAVLARAVLPPAMPLFVDNWRVLPLPAGPAPVPVLLAVLAGLVTFGGAAAIAAGQLVRAVLGRSGHGTGEGT
ncbi:hypothetical protein O7627_05980 [Solwaraspora sp. WMMD1047]|uniref:FtsX-like permease family protein n=1 Tax=Solwaraspora sp. WMMD1047 TaxID=3016102 RepID=UPI002417AB6D|nr:FtsX-like permease family protein [Solwaraspora sp. WMMD1047]MDG4828854.1 hypothetical protein [Solwaraspora sp. WMMD1047]